MATSVATPAAVQAAKGRAIYTRVAVLGLVLIALVPLMMSVLGMLAGTSLAENLMGVAFALVPLIGAALVSRFGTWAKVVGILITLLAAGAMSWAVFGLFYPASFGDFVPGVLMLLGVVLSLGGNVAAIVRRRRIEYTPTTAETRIMRVATAILALAVIGSGAAHLVSKRSVEATAAAGAVGVTMHDFAFAEATYEIAADQPASFLVRNDDAFVHTFTVPELGVHETVLPGSEALVELTAPAGSYTLYCEPHSMTSEPDPEKAGMAATIIAR